MGELIRKIGNLKIKGQDFSIELNEPNNKSTDRIVHLQNDKLRYELKESDFLELCALTLHAADNLSILKNEKK